MLFKKFALVCFGLLLGFSANSADYVMCDYCADAIMTQRAESASMNANAVIVVDRPRSRYYKYIVTRELEPDAVYTTLQRVGLSQQEEQETRAALEVYHKLTQLEKVDVGALNLAPVGQQYAGSALNFAGRPIAIRSLNNAVSQYASQSILVGVANQVTGVVLGKFLNGIKQKIKVDFPDGSSWSFEFTGLSIYWEEGGARLDYKIDPESGLDSQGNPIPFSSNDLNGFSISGNGPFLQGYRDLITRFGRTISGGTQPEECVVVGIRCDRNGCIFIYECP